MRDKGLNRGLVQDFDTSNRRSKGAFYGFRKMFWDYLNKLHVPFSDPCCQEAGGLFSPVRFNDTTLEIERYDVKEDEWIVLSSPYGTAVQNNIAAGSGGAISVANYLTTINTDAGGDAFTLAEGNSVGQMKKILLVVDGGGDGVVTYNTTSTITFDDAGDYVVLTWTGAAWVVVENSGTTLA